MESIQQARITLDDDGCDHIREWTSYVLHLGALIICPPFLEYLAIIVHGKIFPTKEEYSSPYLVCGRKCYTIIHGGRTHCTRMGKVVEKQLHFRCFFALRHGN